MLEFSGNLSEKSQKFLSRKITKMCIWITSIPFAIVFIIIYGLCVLLDYWYIMIGYISVYAITILIGCLVWSSSKFRKSFEPNKITIDTDKIECCMSENQSVQHFDDIKHVIDYGDWYYFDFVTGKCSCEFICQKDLIQKGSIEEFEILFKTKLSKHNTFGRTIPKREKPN